jgi:hypothetical protein
MLGRGRIKNPSCVAFRTSRSHKVIGGQLEAILDSIFAIEQNSRFEEQKSPALLVG